MTDLYAPHRLQPLKPRYDAIVLGSGLGGATAALRLAERGLTVLLVEQGGVLDTGASEGSASQFILDVVPARATPLSFVGGRTKFYGAALYRFRESDFEERVLEAGTSPRWPVTYAELEPYYGAAEAIYKVHGGGHDPTEPPRSTAFPFDPVPFDPKVAAFAERLAKAGAVISPVPRAVDYASGACVNCPACDGFLCGRDAKMDADVAAVRPALRTGRVQLAVDTFCETLLLDASQTRTIGCRLVRDGEAHDISADAVVVSAGLDGTCELLLRSRTSAHPNGLGANGGALGRYMAGHSTGMIFPFMSLSRLKPMQTKSFALNALYDGGPGWDFPLGVIQLAGQTPFWREASRLVRPAAKLVAEHCFTLFYMTETAPSRAAGHIFEGNRVVGRQEPEHNIKTFERLRSYAVDLLARAGYPALARRRRVPYLWHEVGTTRMGEDPTSSVVDRYGAVHGVGGLFIADAGVLPSAGAVNTGLTIAALALRTADYIAEPRP